MTLPADWTSGQSFTAAAENAVEIQVNENTAAIAAVFGGIQQAVVATQESTTSGSYTDLPTTTDSVTVDVGDSGIAIVVVSVEMVSSAYVARTGYAVSGANSGAATDAKSLAFHSQTPGPNRDARGAVFVESGLSPGLTTFKLKYRSDGDASTKYFANRRIAVIPFP